MRKIWIIALSFIAFVACNSGGKKSVEDVAATDATAMFHKVEVKEVIQTTQYTYLKVAEKGVDNYWTAIIKDAVEVGDELFYFNANVTAMEKFHSTELDRDFDRILFISKVAKDKNGASAMGNPHSSMGSSSDMMGGKGEMGNAHTGRKQADPAEGIKVDKAEGGITIAELYENPKSFDGKKVKISGAVVKVNNQIMGRNWVHIQDGSKFNEEYDLTLTTQDLVNLNDVIVIEGVVGIDKDFTSGYFYPVIVENCKVLN